MIASTAASNAAGMWSSVITCEGICALSSAGSVDIGTGSWTLRSKISLEAGLWNLGELDRSREGDAGMPDGYGSRADEYVVEVGCEPASDSGRIALIAA